MPNRRTVTMHLNKRPLHYFTGTLFAGLFCSFKLNEAELKKKTKSETKFEKNKFYLFVRYGSISTVVAAECSILSTHLYAHDLVECQAVLFSYFRKYFLSKKQKGWKIYQYYYYMRCLFFFSVAFQPQNSCGGIYIMIYYSIIRIICIPI